MRHLQVLSSKDAKTDLYHSYNRMSDIPLLVLAAIMVVLLLVPFVFQTTQDEDNLLDTIDWFIYACFAADYLIKLYLAPAKWQHVKTHWLDLVILTLPMLRPLRIARSVRVLRLLRLARLLTFAGAGFEKVRGILVARGLNIILLVTGALVIACAALVTIAEEQGGGSIHDFGDALWWAAATITTVGYGDVVPVTPEGRGIAVFLMITGIAFYSILTANIAAHFIESSAAKEAKVVDGATSEKLDAVLQRLSEIEAQLASLAKNKSE